MVVTAVMVHGAGGGGWEWRLWAATFATGRIHVRVPDLLPAAPGISATRFDDYRAQVRDICCATTSPLVLIGASLGGLLALAVAADAVPAAMVLINPVPPSGVGPRPSQTQHPQVIEWSRSSFESTRRALPDADIATARWTYARWRDESGRVLDEVLDGIVVTKPVCPILVMASANDIDIPLQTSRATATALGADFLTVPGASHLGVLLGYSAPSAAALALAWLNARLTHGNMT